MKQTHKTLFLIFIIALVASMNSCTNNFDDINTNKTKLDTLDKSAMGNTFAAAQYRSVSTNWQLFQSLFSDLQGQYFANVAQNFSSDRNVMVGNWLNGAWNGFYGSAIPPLLGVLENTKPGAPSENAAMYAIANIWKVYMYLPRTDYWGPIPYSQVGNGKNSVAYDSQEFIYKDFLKTLATSVASLTSVKDKEKNVFGNNDQIYAGSVDKWILFGNTLRLRIAMRISKVEPALAKTEAEAAVAGGVFLTNADDAFLKVTASSFNPMNETTGWNEFRMSAAMESVLKGYADPRMSKYFAPVPNTDTFKGLRNGYSQTQLTRENLPKANSNVADQFLPASQATNPFAIMYASEAYFLRAEGALKNWNMGGTAKYLYETGITTALKQWGIDGAAITDYINGTTTPIALKDTVSTPPLTDIPVKFSSDPNKQMEQIITQKWIANFPNGHEAWAEYRRTGFPKLYPRINSDNQDSPKDAVVRRTPFVIGEYSANTSAVQEAIGKLGGEDKSSTRLWWDKP